VQATTGAPAGGFAAAIVPFVSVPALPGYVTLQLNALQFDTSSIRGRAYAIALSSSDTVNWHSTLSASPNYLPVSGLANVTGCWISPDTGTSWSPFLPFRGIRLTAIKSARSPTPSQSQTASQSATPTSSSTRSQTASQTRSQSPSQTQTPTQTASQTGTGFPVEIVIDNSLLENPIIDNNHFRIIDPDTWYGVSMYFPETDPVCGPGHINFRAFIYRSQ